MIARLPPRIALVLLAALVPAGILTLHQFAARQVNNHLPARYAQQIAALPTERAVQFVRHLGSAKIAQPALVASLADKRSKVRLAAAAELSALAERSAALPVSERSALAAVLSRCLANTCSSMPPESHAAAQGLARAILRWPLDGRSIDMAELIANCEAVLVQPLAEPGELRLADAQTEPHRERPR